MRDLAIRWSRDPPGSPEPVAPIVYRAADLEYVLDVFASLLVVAGEGRQPQSAVRILAAVRLLLPRLPDRLREHAADAVVAALPGLEPLARTQLLRRELGALAEALDEVGLTCAATAVTGCQGP